MNIVKMLFIAVIILFCNLCFAKQFVLYDDIGQSGKPSLSGYRLKSLRTIPQSTFWPKNAINTSQPDYDYVRSIAKSKLFSTDIICLDIEHWPLYGVPVSVLDTNIDYLSGIARVVKEAQPNSKVGFYGIIPIRNYRAPIKGKAGELLKWQEQNDRLKRLADSVDIIYPSLYAFSADPAAWRKYAIANIEQARQYNKPVIVYLWPQYHGSAKFLDGQFIDAGFWRIQLETAYELADGAVIWTPWGKMKTSWNPDAGWVRETIRFAEQKLAVPN